MVSKHFLLLYFAFEYEGVISLKQISVLYPNQISNNFSSIISNPYNLQYISKIENSDCKYTRCLHSHANTVEISLIRDGESDYFVNNRNYHVKKGDIFIVGKNIIHHEGHTLPSFCIGINNLDISPELLPDNYLITSQFSNPNTFKSLTDIALMSYNLLKNKTKQDDFLANQIICYALIPNIINSIQYDSERLFTPHVSENAIAKKAKLFIEKYYKVIPNIKFIAQNLEVSQSYLDHLFNDQYHYSPSNYLNLRRIGEAQTLLILKSDLSVTDIAYEVGFQSLSHFNHYFKDFSGISPLKFRQIYTNFA